MPYLLATTTTILLTSIAFADTQYTVTNAGVSFLYHPTAVSSDGTIVGFHGSDTVPWMWTEEAGFQTYELTGRFSDINDSNVVVGYHYVDGQSAPFSWTVEGGLIDLPLACGINGWGNAITSSGKIYGLVNGCGDTPNVWHPVYWNSSTDTDFLQNAGNYTVDAANDNGQVLLIAGAYEDAVLWDNGTTTVLTGLGRGSGINSSGQVVASQYLWDNGITTDLRNEPGGPGTEYNISGSSCINDHGQVAGSFYKSKGDTWFPYIYEDGVVRNLNELIEDPNSDWTLLNVPCISESGMIVCWAQYQDEIDNRQLLLLKPIDCNNNGSPDDWDIEDGSSHDLDSSGVPDECECISDITGDNTVNITDLLIVIATWGTEGPSGDANYDGIVDIQDLLVVIDTWGPCP